MSFHQPVREFVAAEKALGDGRKSNASATLPRFGRHCFQTFMFRKCVEYMSTTRFRKNVCKLQVDRNVETPKDELTNKMPL